MTDLPPPTKETPAASISRAQWSLAALILALALAGFLYRFLVNHRLEQTSALFIGLPAILAIVLAITPPARSATGAILKGMTIALLLSGPILGEGFICILMAAPLFYLIGAIVGLVIDASRRKRGSSATTYGIVLLPLLLASLEGTTPALTFPTHETVSATAGVDGTPDQVRTALARTPAFYRQPPGFLGLKFPRPVSAAGAGLTPGCLRQIHFAGGEGKPGDLLVRVAESTERSIRFEAISDTSKIAHWLHWRESLVEWHALPGGKSEVRWTITYDRALAPALYFGPWERFATREAAGYLIQSLATP